MLEYIPVEERKNNIHSSVLETLWDPEERSFMQDDKMAFVERRDLVRKDETPGKYLAIFERRARKGQCFNQPYLGCREFSCSFRLIDDPIGLPAETISETRDLGFMLYDMDFSVLDNIMPMFFRAKLENGKVVIPGPESEEVRR